MIGESNTCCHFAQVRMELREAQAMPQASGARQAFPAQGTEPTGAREEWGGRALHVPGRFKQSRQKPCVLGRDVPRPWASFTAWRDDCKAVLVTRQCATLAGPLYGRSLGVARGGRRPRTLLVEFKRPVAPFSRHSAASPREVSRARTPAARPCSSTASSAISSPREAAPALPLARVLRCCHACGKSGLTPSSGPHVSDPAQASRPHAPTIPRDPPCSLCEIPADPAQAMQLAVSGQMPEGQPAPVLAQAMPAPAQGTKRPAEQLTPVAAGTLQAAGMAAGMPAAKMMKVDKPSKQSGREGGRRGSPRNTGVCAAPTGRKGTRLVGGGPQDRRKSGSDAS